MIGCGSHKEIGTELESDCIDLDNKRDVGIDLLCPWSMVVVVTVLVTLGDCRLEARDSECQLSLV